MAKQNFKSAKSGQVIIVTALLVSALLLSTALSVIEVGKEVPTIEASQSDVFSVYKQSTTSTLISALANASGGGNLNVLAVDLAALKTMILSNSYQALLAMDYNTLNSNGYQNGLLISWGSNGFGISSAYSSFVFASSSPTAASNLEYTLNLTSTVDLRGNYHQIDDNTKQVTLTFSVQNEGKAALTQNFNVSYRNGTDWIQVNSSNATDFGNGTYTVTFNAEQSQSSDPMVVSLLCQDQRGIFVGANITCTNT